LREKGIVPNLRVYLSSEDGVVRGLAARALGLLGAVEAKEELTALLVDTHMIRFYHDGEISEISVGSFAKSALANS